MKKIFLGLLLNLLLLLISSEANAIKTKNSVGIDNIKTFNGVTSSSGVKTSNGIVNPVALLTQSVFYYDPFYSGSFSGTPANNDPIGTLNDRYGRGTWQLTQATGTSQPLYQSNSGKPYLLFDGVDDVLLTGLIDSSSYFGQSVSLIVVLRSDSVAGTNQNVIKYIGPTGPTRLLGIQVNTQIPNWISGATQNATSTYGTFKVFAGVKATGTNTKKVYTNGVLEATGNAVDITHATENMFLGSFRNAVPYAGFQGGIGEVVAFNFVLSDDQIIALTNYFRNRRAI
jgi:hypothetical protein